MDRSVFQHIKSQYGHYASWAIWSPPGDTPKSNIGDLSVLDFNMNPEDFSILNPAIVLCGLNISRPLDRLFGNFHDPGPHSQDYKLRFALSGTAWYGAYMTDLIKDFEEKASGKVLQYLRANPVFLDENLRTFREEIGELAMEQVTIVALGVQVYELLVRNTPEFRVLKAPHFANYMSKVEYRGALIDLMGS